jgi:RNA polymerase sigma-70 factor (ECF subfamily)
VLQASYLKILQGRARFEGRSSFKTWLFSVIRLTAAGERRRNWLRSLRLAAYAEERRSQPEAARDGSVEAGETQRAFEAALARLPRRQREVLHLVFYQALSIEAAAAAMGVGIGSARTHYARGKERLRRDLKAEFGHEH